MATKVTAFLSLRVMAVVMLGFGTILLKEYLNPKDSGVVTLNVWGIFILIDEKICCFCTNILEAIYYWLCKY